MSALYKFKQGQRVDVVGAGVSPLRPALGKFEIVRLMPEERGIRQYRIRSLLDGHQRMAAESELIG
jgi:hypothetical protein